MSTIKDDGSNYHDDNQRQIIIQQSPISYISSDKLEIAFHKFKDDVIEPKFKETNQKITECKIDIEILKSKANAIFWILIIGIPCMIAATISSVWFLAEKIIK